MDFLLFFWSSCLHILGKRENCGTIKFLGRLIEEVMYLNGMQLVCMHCYVKWSTLSPTDFWIYYNPQGLPFTALFYSQARYVDLCNEST